MLGINFFENPIVPEEIRRNVRNGQEQSFRLDYPFDRLGGYYPSGLVIGSVEEVQKDDSGASSYAVLVPEADLDSLTEVAVIKSFDIVS